MPCKAKKPPKLLTVLRSWAARQFCLLRDAWESRKGHPTKEILKLILHSDLMDLVRTRSKAKVSPKSLQKERKAIPVPGEIPQIQIQVESIVLFGPSPHGGQPLCGVNRAGVSAMTSV